MEETKLIRPMRHGEPEVSLSQHYGVFTISVLTRATAFHVTLSDKDAAKLGKELSSWALSDGEEAA